ncbi:hypothetical protein J4421_05080 [Candidatus Woesearchaeota archaeon]|nr:hypothetical protein [Candidatus Woesearchaeota archaeon]
MTKKKKIKRTLDQIVKQDAPQKVTPSKVYVLSEVGYDTAFFNKQAYQTLLEVIRQDSEITGIIVDGPLTRVDRPEYLNEQLSYWHTSEQEGRRETKKVPNREQYDLMIDHQLEILDERLGELRANAPKTQIVLSIDSDDTQFTISAMVNEAMLRAVQEIETQIMHLKGKKEGYLATRRDSGKRLGEISKVKGTSKERRVLRQQMKNLEKRVRNIDDEMTEQYTEKNLYREKKARPMHQLFTREFVTTYYERFRKLCEKHQVELVTSAGVLEFGALKIDYAHSRRDASWAVIRGRQKELVQSLHGRMDDYVERCIDVVLESGHHGIGFRKLQKVKDVPSEVNFKNQSVYNPTIGEATLTIVMALPFEDQEKISEFTIGKQPIRMSGGKPMNTRKHAVIDRHKNDAVSGVTIISKDVEGLIATEQRQYQDFLDGAALQQPQEYAIICVSSDEHIASPEENVLVRDGFVAQYLFLLENALTINGKEARVQGFISAGDTAEANSRRWNHRYHYKRSPEEVLSENFDLISRLDKKDLAAVIEFVLKTTNDARGGSVEDMSVISERVSAYYERFLWATLEKSKLRLAHVSTPGNHADGVLQDLGYRESDFFVQRLKARDVKVDEAGKPDYYKKGEEPARVFIGGYSNARVAHIEEYGMGVDGKLVFGPINLLIQHDPKGKDGIDGIVNAGKSVDADLTMGGHTHESEVKVYKTGNNKFSVALRLGSLQGVSPTEKHLGNIPRTQAGQRWIMPKPGHFWEQALPAAYLQQKGYESLICKAQEALKRQ